MSILAGIGGTIRALRVKANGNGHGPSIGRSEWQTLRDVVQGLGYSQKLTEANVARLESTLERHDGKLDDIRDDLGRIIAALDRRGEVLDRRAI